MERMRTHDGTVASVITPRLDQEMPSRRRPSRDEAFERIKLWLELNHAASGDEAVTNMRADEIVGLVLDV